MRRTTQALETWEDALARLSECIIEFQRLEEFVAFAIAVLLRKPRRVGEIITTEMSYRARVLTLQSMAMHELKVEEVPGEIREIVSRLFWVEEERNKLVHSLWDVDLKRPDAVTRKKKSLRSRSFKSTTEFYTPDELRELHGIIEGVSIDLFDTLSSLFPALRPRLKRTWS